MQQIERGDINLSPRYQRQYVWPFPKAARLVESVFADLFIPAVVLHTGTNGVWLISRPAVVPASWQCSQCCTAVSVGLLVAVL